MCASLIKSRCMRKITSGQRSPCFTTLFPALNPVPGAPGVALQGHCLFITRYLRAGNQIKCSEALLRCVPGWLGAGKRHTGSKQVGGGRAATPMATPNGVLVPPLGLEPRTRGL